MKSLFSWAENRTLPTFSIQFFPEMTPLYWKEAVQELAANDEVMQDLIQHFEGITLVSKNNAFATLARSIVGQQISVKAAESVWQKVIKAIPVMAPMSMASAEYNLLRNCGLSARKITYLQDLSRHFIINCPVVKSQRHRALDSRNVPDLSFAASGCFTAGRPWIATGNQPSLQ
jgi:hypothetical protein